jgi:hypothetical protein
MTEGRQVVRPPSTGTVAPRVFALHRVIEQRPWSDGLKGAPPWSGPSISRDEAMRVTAGAVPKRPGPAHGAEEIHLICNPPVREDNMCADRAHGIQNNDFSVEFVGRIELIERS